MNFLKKIFFNSIYKELLQNFFSNKNKLNYSLVGFGNPYNSSSSNNEYNFLILNRDDNNRSSSNRSSTRSSNASSSGSSSNRTINSSGKTSKYSGTNRGNYASRNSGNSDDGSEESIESTLKKHKAVRLPTFSVRDKVKEAHKDRIKTGNGYNSNIKELVQQNRKNREEQAIRLQTAKNIDQEEVGDYISALSTAVEGKGIVNNQLKVLAFMIFALIVIMFVIGTFLNQANPLVPILSSINKPLSIKIIDNKDIKIFETKRESRTLTYASNISKNFENAFIALHALNELIYQKSKNQAQEERIPIESIRIDQDFINYLILDYRNYINSPRESIFRANTSIFGTISDVVIAIPNTFLDWANSLFTNKPVFVAGFELLNEFEPADQPLLPDNKIDTYYINEMAKINENVFNKNDFYVINGCKIFKDPEDLSSPACEFSSINIIMTKMYQPDNTGFLARYINPIKDYLLINWLKERVSLSNFFELFLNMTYFGNYQIGMKSSFIDYFEKIAPDTMDVPHALFMIKLLYDNNKNYYPEHEIKVENILDMMIANGYVPENLREDVLAEYKKVKANAKLPRTSFSIYLDRLFLAGYDHFPESYDITVKSTFSNSLQNTLSSMLADQLKRNNIPEGSAIVIQNNQLIVGLTITLVDGRMYYENSYPNAFAYNSIKPFMYLTLLDNRKDVPSQLLSFDKQNLIFSNKRIEQFIKPVINPNLVITEDSPKMTVKELETIESQNLAIMPSGIRKLLAEKLSYLENNFFAEVPAKNYEAMLNRLRITPYEVPVAMPDLLSGDIRVNLFDLARAYTAFQAEPTIVNSGIIDTINGVAEEQYKAQELLSIRKTFTNLLKNIYFNTISTPNGQQFYIMIDFQTAIIFNNDYVVALWLGDLSGDKKFKDTTENLEILVRNVLNLLQQ